MAYDKVPSLEELTKKNGGVQPWNTGELPTDVDFGEFNTKKDELFTDELPDGSSREYHDSLPDGVTFDELPDDISLAEDDVRRLALSDSDAEKLLLHLEQTYDAYSECVGRYTDIKKELERYDHQMNVAFSAFMDYFKAKRNGV